MAIPLNDKVLKEKAKDVTLINGRIRKLAKHMQQTMRAFRGVGLAAPQIGESLRMFVMIPRPMLDWIIINPRLVRVSVETETAMEGCLSHPEKVLPVERAKFLEIEYTTIGGKTKTMKATGFLARVIQHELDHLDGLTILETAKKEETTNAQDKP